MKSHTITVATSLVALSLGLCLTGCQSEMAGGKMTGSADPKMSDGKMGTEMMSDGKMADGMMEKR